MMLEDGYDAIGWACGCYEAVYKSVECGVGY